MLKAAVLAAATAALMAQTPDAALRWMEASSADVEINGLPWLQENKGELIRLPLRLQKEIPPAVWGLAKSPAGARIRFRTDSKKLALKLEYPSAPNMANMHAFGQTGVDVYIGNVYLSTATADKDAVPGKVYEKTFDLGARRERDITLYLSLYKPVKVLGIGVEKDAKVSKASPFAVPLPVVYYGTSITQGGCASRPGMSYQAIVGRALNLDHVNLGFSGNGKGEPILAQAVGEIEASCYVLDYCQNNRTVESIAEVYGPFLDALRAKRPNTPIVAITPIFASREVAESGLSEYQKMRDHIRQAVAKRIAAGDTRLQIVEGTDLLGPAQVDGLVDGVHPNDLGFEWMARGLEPRLRKMLGLR